MERPREKGGKVVFIGNIPYGMRYVPDLHYLHTKANFAVQA